VSLIATRIRRLARLCAIALSLTYCSLIVPGSADRVCSNVDIPVYCPALAYGFPFPFLADSQAVSPVGSVARDPISLLVGLDDVLWSQFWLSVSVWAVVTVVANKGLAAFKKHR